MSLRQALRSGVAAISIASVVAPAGAAPTTHAAPKAAAATAAKAALVQVHVGQAATFSRIEFRGVAATSRRDGQTVTISFGRDGDPDISRLRTSPPRWVKTAEARHAGGRLQVVITIADDADAKLGAADGATYVNVFEKPPPDPKAVEAARLAAIPPEPQRPNPLPPGGVVHMDSRVANGQVQFTFAWANPAGAAVFRRGDAVWIVFDAPAKLDVSKAPRGLPQFTDMQASRGTDYAAIRIDAAHGIPVFATALGSAWTISLGPGSQTPPSLVKVTRDEASGPATLKAPVAGATRIVRLSDPLAGDTLSVVTALGPAKGLPSRREYVQMALLPSVQGLAAESYIEDLAVSRDGDIVKFGRPAGLALSPKWAAKDADDHGAGGPAPAPMPALIDYVNWPKTGS
ncbi:MAG: endoglucanase, partial [Phenylobacterium sp.]